MAKEFRVDSGEIALRLICPECQTRWSTLQCPDECPECGSTVTVRTIRKPTEAMQERA